MKIKLKVTMEIEAVDGAGVTNRREFEAEASGPGWSDLSFFAGGVASTLVSTVQYGHTIRDPRFLGLIQQMRDVAAAGGISSNAPQAQKTENGK